MTVHIKKRSKTMKMVGGGGRWNKFKTKIKDSKFG